MRNFLLLGGIPFSNKRTHTWNQLLSIFDGIGQWVVASDEQAADAEVVVGSGDVAVSSLPGRWES